MNPTIPNNSSPDHPALEIPSTVNFATALLEHLMMLAGNTTVQSGWFGKDYLIRLANHRFYGKTEAEALTKVMYWVLTHDLPMTKEAYQLAADGIPIDRTEDELLIEELTQGGMTDFGKKVQTFREERGAQVFRVLRSIRDEDPNAKWNNDTLRERIERDTGLTLDVEELLVALRDFYYLSSFEQGV